MSTQAIHYPEGEENLLALMTSYPTQIDLAKDSIPLEAFFTARNRILYQIILNRRASSLACDVMALINALREQQKLETLFGVNGNEIMFLNGLASVHQWEYFATQVMSRYHARNVVAAAKEIMDAATMFPETLSETVEKLLPTMQTQYGKSSMRPLKDLLHEATDRWQCRKSRGINFGIKPLDEATGGAFPGEVTIICGQAKSGKTSLAMQIGTNIAQQGKGVGVFSLEMSDSELVDRMVANEGGINLQKFRTQVYSATDLASMGRSITRMMEWPVWVSRDSFTFSSIYSECRRLKARHGIFLVLVDYIQLVETARVKGESREQQVAGISRGLKRIAMELGVHVIALSQLNEDGKLRESRAIGQDANLVLCVEPGKQPQDRILRIALQRNGPAGGEIPLTFRGDCVRFDT